MSTKIFKNKIVFIDDARTYGGAQIAMVNAISVLREFGCENLVVLYSEDNSQLHHLLNSIGDVELVKCPRSLPVNILFFPIALPVFFRIFLSGQIWNAKAVVVNLSGIEFGLAPTIAANILKVRVIGWLHLPNRLEELVAPNNLIKRTFYRFRDRFADFWVFGLYQKFLVPSVASENVLRTRCRVVDGSVSSIYNVFKSAGDLVPTRAINFSNKKITVAVVGRVDFRHKGQDILPGVCEMLVDRGVDPVFKIVGSGGDLDLLKDKVRISGLADRFEFLGWRSDVTDILVDSDILFVPSKFEGLPLVACEGIYAGCRVVSSPLSCFYEVLPERCIADHHSVAAYCDKLIQMAEEDAGNLAADYLSKLEKFSPATFFSNFERVVLND